jgi:hypothetical protein
MMNPRTLEAMGAQGRFSFFWASQHDITSRLFTFACFDLGAVECPSEFCSNDTLQIPESVTDETHFADLSAGSVLLPFRLASIVAFGGRAEARL